MYPLEVAFVWIAIPIDRREWTQAVKCSGEKGVFLEDRNIVWAWFRIVLGF